MPTFLSPGVFPREIDLSLNVGNVGPLRPAFIGTAKKGPMNTPTLVSGPEQAIEKFGERFPESYLMYDLLTALEEAASAYVVRVGVEERPGLPDALADVCIDTSGARGAGWGRIPVFTGIDYGRITLRAPTADTPCVFHESAVESIDYNDQEVSDTDGPTTATLDFASGTDASDDYTGCTDDSYIVLITSDPDPSRHLEGAAYQVIRNSDDEVVAEGTLSEIADGVSATISIGDGLVFRIEVTDGRLAENDTFTFTARPDNRSFAVSVENGAAVSYTLPAGTYDSVTDLVNAINVLIGAEDYQAISRTQSDGTVVPQLVTNDAGRMIQLTGTCQFAAEVGIAQYTYDIPRSYLLGTDEGPYAITSANNRVKIDIIPRSGDTVTAEFSLATGVSLAAADVAAAVDLGGVVSGTTYFDSFAMTVPGGAVSVVVVTDLNHMWDRLRLVATYSNIKTLRFAEEVGIAYPYSRAYRGFRDYRTTLPDGSTADASIPLSCETDPAGDECAADTAYYANIVGWLVAPSPGTWVDDFTITLSIQVDGVGEASGRYQLAINDTSGNVVDLVTNLSFDQTVDRYIGNVLNPGSTYGGVNGFGYVSWEERPSYLNNDPDEADTYEVRQPAELTQEPFVGGANGVPTDPSYSDELDAAVLGNAAEATGLFSLQNTETYDINILVIPGFTSGAVIGRGLQLCESRGDALYVVDPPFGLRPQQVVDWHNGMLTSDLAAAINSSYGALYWGWTKILDSSSRQYVWIPPSGHVTGVIARTARVAEKWYAPAGTRRGHLVTAVDVEYNPGGSERDLLQGSGNAVNPLVKFPQQGIIVMGQRTLQRSETALSRVNVRMLINDMKKGMTTLLRDFIFEPHDSQTWAAVRNVLNPYCADIQARRGLDGFLVVCDERNNTPERRDRYQLWVSVFLKPTRAIEFVLLNLIILQSSASFLAEEVLAAGGVASQAQAV